MSNFKEKSQVFLIGLMAGLLIAGAFFILKLDDYFKELNFYKNINKTFHAEPQHDSYQLTESTKKAIEKVPVKWKKPKDNTIKTDTVTVNDSTASNNKIKNIVLDADTLKISLLKDSSALTTTSTENIVVRKDELISTKTIEVINLGLPGEGHTAKDSLLHKVSGITIDKKNTKQFVNIELWQSPLNYKGYKMSKYKIALYGIESLDKLKVYSLDENIFLKNGSLVFKLKNSNEFKPYEHVTDETLISKLK